MRLNWKEVAGRDRWQAYAGRVVGGRYWIQRLKATDYLGRALGPVSFRVAHSINLGRGLSCYRTRGCLPFLGASVSSFRPLLRLTIRRLKGLFGRGC
jgi:hypothetical protein